VLVFEAGCTAGCQAQSRFARALLGLYVTATDRPGQPLESYGTYAESPRCVCAASVLIRRSCTRRRRKVAKDRTYGTGSP